MSQTQPALSTIWHRFQTSIFPDLQEELGPFTKKQQQFVEVLEIAQIEAYFPYIGRGPGRPPKRSVCHCACLCC